MLTESREFWDQLAHGLNMCIKHHGPITSDLIPSAVQRMLSMIVLEDVATISPRTALFIIQMMNIKYDAKEFQVALRRLAPELAAAEERLKKANVDKAALIAAISKSPDIKKAVEEVKKIYNNRNNKYKQEAHKRHQELVAEISGLKRQLDDTMRWMDDGGK